MVTIASLFADNVAADPARPLLTWYSPQERTELSGATLANWVAKTANLLVDECGLGPGDTARVNLPPHWQTSAIMLACWTAGLAIAHSDSVPADVVFGLAGTKSDYLVSLHPFALPVPELRPGEHDWVLAARTHGDRYGGAPAPEDAPALVGLPQPVSHRDLAERALARAAELGIAKGARILVNVDTHPRPLDWLAAPLAAGASLVLCYGMDADSVEKSAHVERVSLVVG